MRVAVLLTLFFLFLAREGHAACIPKPNVVLVYINGIQNDPFDANSNLNVYQASIQEQIPNITVKLAYNQSRGFWSDSDEVTAQKINELSNVNPNLKIDALRSAFMFGDYSLFTEYLQLANDIKQERINILVKLYENYATANDTVEVVSWIYNYYQTNHNASILLLPHSQGNLYANDAYTALVSTGKIPKNQIGIVGVASPASTVSGITSPSISDYITASEDGIINLARVRYAALFGYLPVLPWDLDALSFEQIGANITDTHGLATFYLSSEFAARKPILDAILAKYNNLIQQNPVYALEVIWGDSPNMDLSVSEASGRSSLAGTGSGIGSLTNSSTSGCYALTHLEQDGQYIAMVHNGSGSSVPITVNAIYPGGTYSNSIQLAPDSLLGTFRVGSVLSDFVITPDLVAQYGYPKYTYNAFL